MEEMVRIFSASFRNNQRLLEASFTFTKLLHITGPDTQDAFETLKDTGTEYQHALNKLDECFSIKRTFLLGDLSSTVPHNKKVEVWNSLSHS